MPLGPSSAIDVLVTTSIETTRLNSSKVDSTGGDENHQADAPVDTPVEERVVDTLKVVQPTKAKLFQQIATLALRKAHQRSSSDSYPSYRPKSKEPFEPRRIFTKRSPRRSMKVLAAGS